MSTFILVHGGDRDGSIWDGVASRLGAMGHEVHCPSLPSVKNTALQAHIDQVVRLIIEDDLQDIILCGHSYGAMVITGVHDQVADRIQQLVFVDSVVPTPGKSLFDNFAEVGWRYQDFDLTPDQACLDILSFDASVFHNTPKAYIHCMQSEFYDIVRPMFEKVSDASVKDWLVFSLNAPHGCMFTHAPELAVLFNGLSGLQPMTHKR